jgi:hypothetical protein
MNASGHSGLKARLSLWFSHPARRHGADHEFSPDQAGDGSGDPELAVCAACGKPFDQHDPVHLRKQGGRGARVCVDCHTQYGSMSARRGS